MFALLLEALLRQAGGLFFFFFFFLGGGGSLSKSTLTCPHINNWSITHLQNMVIVRSVTNSTKPYNIGSTDMLTVPLVKLVASIAGSNTEAIHGGIQHDERNDNTVLGQAPEFTRNWISWRKLQCWSYHNRGRSLVIKIISHSTLPSITIPFSRCYLHLYIICRSLRSTFYNVALDGCLLESRYGYFFSFLKCLPSVKKSICVHHGHYYSLKPGLPMCGGGGGRGLYWLYKS